VIETVVLHCPYCGERFESVVDLSAGSQRYVEDCAVCCRPIEIALTVDANGELVEIATHSDRD
jgi:transcription elongation factor Elf1